MDDGAFSDEFSSDEWDHLSGGVLICFESGALLHLTEADRFLRLADA
jgi:hypothetical protein